MKYFKYGCAALALIYLAIALLPTKFAAQQAEAAVVPVWIGRAVAILDFVLLSSIFYGLQQRYPAFWRAIPILLVVYLLSILISAFWTLIVLSLPWLPFLFVVTFILIGASFFYLWWRKQQNYFS